MINEQAFRDLMAGVCAPVTIVTTHDDGPHGATVSAFASLSLRPPMVTVALDRASGVLARILATGRFGVNVLDPFRLAADGAPVFHYGAPGGGFASVNQDEVRRRGLTVRGVLAQAADAHAAIAGREVLGKALVLVDPA